MSPGGNRLVAGVMLVGQVMQPAVTGPPTTATCTGHTPRQHASQIHQPVVPMLWPSVIQPCDCSSSWAVNNLGRDCRRKPLLLPHDGSKSALGSRICSDDSVGSRRAPLPGSHRTKTPGAFPSTQPGHREGDVSTCLLGSPQAHRSVSKSSLEAAESYTGKQEGEGEGGVGWEDVRNRVTGPHMHCWQPCLINSALCHSWPPIPSQTRPEVANDPHRAGGPREAAHPCDKYSDL
jgi:hypothetical protein